VCTVGTVAKRVGCCSQRVKNGHVTPLSWLRGDCSLVGDTLVCSSMTIGFDAGRVGRPQCSPGSGSNIEPDGYDGSLNSGHQSLTATATTQG
jgi:hypothetical protein